jgi:hypothetical protein
VKFLSPDSSTPAVLVLLGLINHTHNDDDDDDDDDLESSVVAVTESVTSTSTTTSTNTNIMIGSVMGPNIRGRPPIGAKKKEKAEAAAARSDRNNSAGEPEVDF